MDVLFGKPLITSFKSIITEASKKLIIISPYIDFKKEFEETIKIKENEGLEITIIYSGNEKSIDKWIIHFDLKKVELKVFYMKNLHSKLYLNENKGLVTSKNMYEKGDGSHNEEIGVLFNKSDKGYRNIEKYIARIIEKSNEKKRIVRWE